MKKILSFLLILLVLTCQAIEPKKVVTSTMTTGGTFTCTSVSQSQILRLSGNPTLTGNYTVVADGNEVNGMTIIVENIATPTLSGGHVILFGTTVPDYLVGKVWTAECICTKVSDWKVIIKPGFSQAAIVSSNQIVDTTIITGDIKDEAVTVGKMADLTRGSLITGQTTGNRPAALDGKSVNYLLGGDGTDVVSYPLDASAGDIGLTIAGSKWVFDIAASKVGTAEIAAAAIGNGLTGGGGSAISVLPDATTGTSIVVAATGTKLSGDVTAPGANYTYSTNSAGTKGWYANTTTTLQTTVSIGTAEVLTLNGSPVLAIAAPGAGKAIVVESAIMSLTFATTPYATNTALEIISGTADVAQWVGTAYLAATKSSIMSLIQYGITDKTQIIDNKGVYISVPVGNPATGDSDIKIYLKYRIITL